MDYLFHLAKRLDDLDNKIDRFNSVCIEQKRRLVEAQERLKNKKEEIQRARENYEVNQINKKSSIFIEIEIAKNTLYYFFEYYLIFCYLISLLVRQYNATNFKF